MDEMKIGSKFVNGIVSSIIRKVIKKKFGGDFVVEFLDPIEYYYDDNTGLADIHLNVNLHVRKETIQTLLKDLV